MTPKTIKWTEDASDDYDEVLYYLTKERGEGVARLVLGRVDEAVRRLGLIPTGRIGRIFGLYEKYVSKTSYIIAYELTNESTLTIIRIIHTSRDWSSDGFPE